MRGSGESIGMLWLVHLVSLGGLGWGGLDQEGYYPPFWGGYGMLLEGGRPDHTEGNGRTIHGWVGGEGWRAGYGGETASQRACIPSRWLPIPK
jgi:hypothetical protein